MTLQLKASFRSENWNFIEIITLQLKASFRSENQNFIEIMTLQLKASFRLENQNLLRLYLEITQPEALGGITRGDCYCLLLIVLNKWFN